MKTLKLIIILFFTILLACTNDEGEASKDLEKPTITINYDGGFPTSCAQLKRGKEYTIKAKVSDNVALASYAIDVHNNFDHHTHDDQGSKCDLEPIKNPTSNTFKYAENFQIAENIVNYEISKTIKIPTNADTGDYHCQLSVTDITGWSKRTSIDVKIVE